MKYSIAPTTLLIAGMALAPSVNAQTVYIAGTHPIGQSATVTRGEGNLMTGDPNAYLVQYPRELAPLVGTMSLDDSVAAGVKNTPKLQDGDTVVCVSQGCLISNQINTTANITRVNYGDPTNSDGGLLVKLGVKPASHNPDIAAEYDLIADAPDYPNPISWVNAVIGAAYEHGSYSKVKYDTGQTQIYGTHTIIKAENLPLTRPLRQLGINKQAVDALDKVLRPIVDSGYKRGSTNVKSNSSSVANSSRTSHAAGPSARRR